jgi:uncharacterized protein YabN with tetrapyrrole methylase and pyrophosphatase domain
MSTAGERFDELVEIMRRLRAPDGCPWDREQTLASLRPFLLEETYETLDAIETIATKLVRRHPHVFGEAERAQSAEEVLGRWEDLKREERAAAGAAPKTTLGGVPKTLPGLLRAYEYGSRAASVGFDWERATDVIAKIEEEVAEVREVLEGPGLAFPATEAAGGASPTDGSPEIARQVQAERLEEEVGDLLFAIANLSRKLGIEPETALRRANDKFAARFTELERRFGERGEAMKAAGLDALESEWQRIKRE